jgi:hypothetical protein
MLLRAADDCLKEADEKRRGHIVIKANYPKPDGKVG